MLCDGESFRISRVDSRTVGPSFTSSSTSSVSWFEMVVV